MQKFTRALTREIELAGQRLKITLDEKGISVSLVGLRRAPREITWASLIAQLSTGAAAEPDAAALASAIESFKSGATTRKPAPPAPPSQTPSAQDVMSLLRRLESWLKTHRPRYAQALKPGASDEDLCGGLGASIPEELRQLLAWHNGQSEDFRGAFEGSWSLMSAEQIGAAKRELDAQAGQGGWQPAWIPFLENDEGDYLILDSSQSGMPVREYRQTSTESPIIAPSLTAWLSDFVVAVEAGKYHEDPERGQFLRQRE